MSAVAGSSTRLSRVSELRTEGGNKKMMKLRMGTGVIVISTALLFLCLPFCSSTVPNDPFFGIAPQDEKYYKSSDVIRCKDGSGKFTKAQLNDDFCDCPDGTDEPGTSACPGGKFYCHNAGHVPNSLFSSRVNDGICDCCDGTDEYDGKVTCSNTCWEAGKVARDKLKKKIATYQDGVKLRKDEIEKAKSALDKDKAELLKLKKEESTLKEIVQQLKEHKEEIEKEEEKERLRKEKEEKEKKEAEEKANEEKSAATGEEARHTNEAGKHSDAKDYAADETKYEQSDVGDSYDGATDSPSSEGSLLNEVEESVKGAEGEHAAKSETDLRVEEKKSSEEIINTGNDASENTEGLSKEELGQLVASRWTGQKGGKQSGEAEDAKKTEEQEDLTSESNNEEYEGYASETDDDSNRYDGEDETEDDFREDERDDVSSSYKPDTDFEGEPDLSDSPSWLTKIQRTVRKLFKAVNFFETPLNQTDAARVRKEYDELSSKLSKLQSRVSSLTQKLKHDFGPESEFYSFYDRCFESKQNKYTYKVCPYDQASQEEGYSTTRLGRWDKFEDSYKVMAFSNGDRCWNGPDRSMKVRMRCGLKNEITDVDEPSRCEYVALLSTPALCKEEKLKELQHKLDSLNSQQPEKHDEL